MAAQAALIADTIVGMKKALSKENDCSGPDDPITQSTNRGNKLRANASHVREGALGYIHSEKLYKQKVDHAGYTRYILQRNPVRYDSEGDELDEDDEDSEADAAAAEDNPFSEIALENLLCPLKHPSELPIHPSMSHPYTSKALREMTRAVESKLHQEKALLWRARNLHRQFLGDSCWMPCAMVETPEDRWNFAPGPNPRPVSPVNRGGNSGTDTPLAASGFQGIQKDGNQGLHSDAVSPKQTESLEIQDEVGRRETNLTDADVEMLDTPANNEKNAEDGQIEVQTKDLKTEDVDATVRALPQHKEAKASSPGTRIYGGDTENLSSEQSKRVEQSNGGNSPAKSGVEQSTLDGTREPQMNDETQEETDNDIEMEDKTSPEPFRRMTTRAQTNAAHPHQENGISNNLPSPSVEAISALPTPHPLFLVPDGIRPDPDFGLPPNEAEDTRRLLWSYIQKQEETVRGFEHMLECLLLACQMKENVWEWCKAEGHLGEMSDGEDWYDPETWGLAPGEELKKGADEDEAEAVDEDRTSGKRGRRRQ